jgi:hypothetical protein
MKWIVGIPVMIVIIALLFGLAYLMGAHPEVLLAILLLSINTWIVWRFAPVVGEEIIEAFDDWRLKRKHLQQ